MTSHHNYHDHCPSFSHPVSRNTASHLRKEQNIGHVHVPEEPIQVAPCMRTGQNVDYWFRSVMPTVYRPNAKWTECRQLYVQTWTEFCYWLNLMMLTFGTHKLVTYMYKYTNGSWAWYSCWIHAHICYTLMFCDAAVPPHMPCPRVMSTSMLHSLCCKWPTETNIFGRGSRLDWNMNARLFMAL